MSGHAPSRSSTAPVELPPCIYVTVANVRRCRLGVTIRDLEDEAVHTLHGWAELVDQVVHIVEDEQGEWMTFPLHAVNWIEWNHNVSWAGWSSEHSMIE